MIHHTRTHIHIYMNNKFVLFLLVYIGRWLEIMDAPPPLLARKSWKETLTTKVFANLPPLPSLFKKIFSKKITNHSAKE